MFQETVTQWKAFEIKKYSTQSAQNSCCIGNKRCFTKVRNRRPQGDVLKNNQYMTGKRKNLQKQLFLGTYLDYGTIWKNM